MATELPQPPHDGIQHLSPDVHPIVDADVKRFTQQASDLLPLVFQGSEDPVFTIGTFRVAHRPDNSVAFHINDTDHMTDHLLSTVIMRNGEMQIAQYDSFDDPDLKVVGQQSGGDVNAIAEKFDWQKSLAPIPEAGMPNFAQRMISALQRAAMQRIMEQLPAAERDERKVFHELCREHPVGMDKAYLHLGVVNNDIPGSLRNKQKARVQSDLETMGLPMELYTEARQGRQEDGFSIEILGNEVVLSFHQEDRTEPEERTA